MHNGNGSATDLTKQDALPTRVRSVEHTPNSIRELETAAEVRFGAAQTLHAGETIIPSEEAKYDRSEGKEPLLPLSALTAQVRHDPNLPRRPPVNTDANAEQSLVDIILLSIQAFFGLFYPSSGDDDMIIGSEEDRRLAFLTDEDIDNLAVFQGDVKDFVELQEGQVAPRKIQKMKALLTEEDHVEWERRCRQLMNPMVLHHPMIRELGSYRARLRGYLGTWNPTISHCSDNIYLLDDQLTVHRIPMVNQTDAVRSKLGVMSGVHAWDMKVTGPIGTHFSVGVATENAILSTRAGYVSLIGDDEESWGWDIVWGNVSHRRKTIGDYPSTIIYQYTPGDIIRLILDCGKGEMSFAVNEMLFGVACTNLPTDIPLFPTVGLVYGNMEVTLIYLGKPPPLRN